MNTRLSLEKEKNFLPLVGVRNRALSTPDHYTNNQYSQLAVISSVVVPGLILDRAFC